MELTKKEKKIIAQLLLLEQIQLTDDMIKGKKLVIDCMDYCDSISSILKKLGTFMMNYENTLILLLALIMIRKLLEVLLLMKLEEIMMMMISYLRMLKKY